MQEGAVGEISEFPLKSRRIKASSGTVYAVGQARRHGLASQPNNHKHSPSLPFNGLHPRNPCNYMDYYSFTDSEGMEG